MATKDSIFWLRHDAASLERARELIKAFHTPDTVDELGLGIIRDAISDEFFPGITSQQTSIKYFIFLSFLYHKLQKEKGGKASDNAELASDFERLEIKLCNRLCANFSGSGIIGRNSIGENTQGSMKSYPSLRYWQGLLKWGLVEKGEDRSNGFSQDNFFSHVVTINRRAEPSAETPDADPVYFELDGLCFEDFNKWLDEKTNFAPVKIWPDLAPEEKAFLKARLHKATSLNKTLFISLLDSKVMLPNNCHWLWDLPKSCVKGYEHKIAEAKLFSFYARGAYLLYDACLENPTMVKEQWRDLPWRKALKTFGYAGFTKEISAAFAGLQGKESEVSDAAAFIKELLQIIKRSDSNFQSEIYKCLEKRERRCRSSRARLTKRTHRARTKANDGDIDSENDQSSFSDSLFQYDFRFGKARKYINALYVQSKRH